MYEINDKNILINDLVNIYQNLTLMGRVVFSQVLYCELTLGSLSSDL